MTKSSAAREPAEQIAPPRSIQLVVVAIGVVIAGLAVRALGLLGSSDTLISYLVKTNADAKKPVANYLADHAQADLHALRVGAGIEAAVVAVALLLLAFSIRRTRTASGSRWALLIVLVLTSTPFYVIPVVGWPILPQAASVVAGVGAIAALVLTFLPTSMQYFRQCRDAMVPPELRGQPRPSLFGSRRQRPGGGLGSLANAGRPATRPAATRPGPAAASSTRSKAKVRSDADAIAKGAELARSRAKASKPRRSE